MHIEILFDWIEGQRLAVRRGMRGATGNVYVGLHEFADMILPLHFLREGDLFLDIGSNVGTYAVLASGVCRARTLAFEPDPVALAHLKRNIEFNNLGSLVEIHSCALGAERCEVAFTVGLDTVNRIATAGDRESRTVQMERADTVVGESGPLMMKIDVEGAEEGVLLGATMLLANPCLRIIELETVTRNSAEILKRNNFEQAYYDPFQHTLGRHPIELKSANSLFVRDWSFVTNRLSTARKVKVLGRLI